jgi:hypothetical protein
MRQQISLEEPVVDLSAQGLSGQLKLNRNQPG